MPPHSPGTDNWTEPYREAVVGIFCACFSDTGIWEVDFIKYQGLLVDKNTNSLCRKPALQYIFTIGPWQWRWKWHQESNMNVNLGPLHKLVSGRTNPFNMATLCSFCTNERCLLEPLCYLMRTNWRTHTLILPHAKAWDKSAGSQRHHCPQVCWVETENKTWLRSWWLTECSGPYCPCLPKRVQIRWWPCKGRLFFVLSGSYWTCFSLPTGSP